jgi:hypothetical protein
MEITTVADLSAFHYLLSDLFRWPNSKEEWDQYRLSKEQVDFFHEYGYVSGIKFLEEWQIKQLNEELAEIIDPSHPEMNYFINLLRTNLLMQIRYCFMHWVHGESKKDFMMCYGIRLL